MPNILSPQQEAPAKKQTSHKILVWIVAGVVALFLLILTVGWIPRHNRNKETAQAAQQQKTDIPEIEVVEVTRAKDGSGLVLPGTTTPLTESSVYARANGYLKQRFVDLGDHVRKGQLLALIDAPDLDQQVDQARQQVSQSEAQLAQQTTQLALTRVTVGRYRVLVQKGVFSRQEGDQREADYAAQQANVAAAERNVEAFKANLRRVIALQGYERVVAPFSGVVTERNVDIGALISAAGSAGSSAPTPTPIGQTSSSSQGNGATNTSGASGNASNLATNSTGGGQGGALFTIAQSDRLRILVSVPEDYADQVKVGQHTTLHFGEFADESFSGDVTRTSGSIDQNTRTLLTEIQIENRAGRLLPGMYAVVTFSAKKGENPLVIPGDAIAVRNDHPTVAVISGDKVKLVPVTIGRDYGSEVEIVGGLREGDLIASTFTDDVREDATVRTRPSKQEQAKQEQAKQQGGKANSGPASGKGSAQP